ncbi:hypothetical protein BJV82DRAFT_665056 [Fennellomyces sp. T-0311]|nr:hypothetical protein BJV82DRAFT_665056 [Fennellomyces sp. T-0311]
MDEHTQQHYHNVTFKDIIQQVCRDFGINYVWYDQMCIDQNDPEERRREIQRMYDIYKNANCTIALIPELCVKQSLYSQNIKSNIGEIMNAAWSKRMWTLEEALVSNQLLFVGQNSHVWFDTIQECASARHSESDHFLLSLCKRPVRWNASTTLWHAHRRTSTREHDRVFALANLFSWIKDDPEFSFSDEQDITELKIHFYRLLAKVDLSVLCFGCPEYEDAIEAAQHNDTSLPSWTGVAGRHVPQFLPHSDELPETSFKDYSIVSNKIVVNCTCTYISLQGEPLLDQQNLEGLSFLPVSDQHQDSSKERSRAYGLKTTHLFSEKVKRPWAPLLEPQYDSMSFLSLTEECTECIILSGIPFNTDVPNYQFYPVVRQDGDHYKSIGLCFACLDDSDKVAQELTIE